MDSARYVVALLLTVFTPPAFAFWFSIHPFIGFWRRVGMKTTLAVHYALMIALAGLLYLGRGPLLSVEFGTSLFLMASGILLLVVSGVMRRRISQQLRFSTLTGMPELDPGRRSSPLLTGGIYGRIRHPRYVQMILAAAAAALFSNYLAAYAVLGVLLLVVPVLVRLEERELRDRFGAEYDAYSARVPRFIPKLPVR